MAALAVRDAFETQCLQNQRQDGQPGIPSPGDLHTVGKLKAVSARHWVHQLRVHPGRHLSRTTAQHLHLQPLQALHWCAICLAQGVFVHGH